MNNTFIQSVHVDGKKIFCSTPPALAQNYNAQPWWTYKYIAIPHEWCPRCNNFTPHVGGVCDICEVGGVKE